MPTRKTATRGHRWPRCGPSRLLVGLVDAEPSSDQADCGEDAVGYIIMAYVVMAYVVMAYVVLACVVMAYAAMAYIAMA